MDSELLEQLAEAARRLESLLTQEFEALKGQQIDAFEALQAEKRRPSRHWRAQNSWLSFKIPKTARRLLRLQKIHSGIVFKIS